MWIGARSGASLQQRGCAEGVRRGEEGEEGERGARGREVQGKSGGAVCLPMLAVCGGWLERFRGNGAVCSRFYLFFSSGFCRYWYLFGR